MAKPRLTPDRIRAALRDDYGAVDLHRLTEGEESQAFTFTHRDTELVIRVNHAQTGFAKDAWAHRTLGRVIPVPRVHRIGRIAQHHYCLTTRLPGHIIQDTTDPARLSALAPAVAATADHIAGADLSGLTGYGDFNPTTGIGAHDTWTGTILALTAIDLGDHERLRPAINRLRDAVIQATPHLPDGRQLIHGDFGANNLLTDGTEITGVIDWESAMIGDPRYDIANTRFWGPFLPCMHVQSTYDDQRLTDQTDRDAVRCYLIAIGVRAVGYYLASGRTEIAHAMIDRTESAL